MGVGGRFTGFEGGKLARGKSRTNVEQRRFWFFAPFPLVGSRRRQRHSHLMRATPKIISGAQTGADRAALDWAIFHDVPHGGWCPKGRKAEDGPIAAHYALKETPSASYPQRTQWNVRDSDGTVIFTMATKLTGGSKLTADAAKKLGKPWLHLSAGNYSPAADLLEFITAHNIEVLNVAGTRGSKEPEVGKFVKRALEEAFFPRPSGWLGGEGEG
jgi:hypothetical protein